MDAKDTARLASLVPELVNALEWALGNFERVAAARGVVAYSVNMPSRRSRDALVAADEALKELGVRRDVAPPAREDRDSRLLSR
jgi:hypothetical protein